VHFLLFHVSVHLRNPLLASTTTDTPILAKIGEIGNNNDENGGQLCSVGRKNVSAFGLF